mgnify:FL=1|jgi:hypothetical protein|tara:strand:- start:310 stop:561 length:252 start_codon:yes stop_codon:yes gene_type:complete
MEIMHILVAGSLVVVGLTTLGYAGAVSGFVNRDLFTIPIVNIAITPLALMGLVPLSLGAGMLLGGGDLLGIRDEVYGPAVIDF